MSPHTAQFQPALHALLLMTTWHGHRWIDLERHRDGETKHTWLELRGRRQRQQAVRLVQRLDEKWSPEILMPLPRLKQGWGTVTQATVLWARLEGTDQYERARRFKPRPTLVLQEGTSSRRLLLWGLLRPLSWDQTVQANRRLAYRFRSVQKAADPDMLRIPMPGSCLREGRSKPVPIRVARLDLDGMYTPREIVGSLKDPPEVKWWEKAA